MENETASSARRPARIAVLVPCFNEETTVAQVVRDFRDALPGSSVYVFDNNSTDRTVERAKDAGATVLHERRQGKGYVVQAMFRKVEADVYLMVDGDGTYPARSAPSLVGPVLADEADMVVGSRLAEGSASDFRALNRLGNILFLRLLNSIFGVRLTDLLSGYRAFSRRLVRGIPLLGGGFETEAEMTIRSIERGFRIVELPVDLAPRPGGSESKIRVFHDGFLILRTIFSLLRDYRPLSFFGSLASLFVLGSLAPFAWVLSDFLRTGQVLRLPSAVLAVGMVLVGVILAVVGLILHTVSRRFAEVLSQVQRITDDLGKNGESGD